MYLSPLRRGLIREQEALVLQLGFGGRAGLALLQCIFTVYWRSW
jgi:hypothetical protein